MIEPGGAEVVAEILRETFVVTEDDTGDDRPPLTSEAGRERAVEPRAQPIGKAAEPASGSDTTRQWLACSTV